jgi:hypothetical protein
MPLWLRQGDCGLFQLRSRLAGSNRLAISGRRPLADATVGRYPGTLNMAFSDRRVFQSALLLARSSRAHFDASVEPV